MADDPLLSVSNLVAGYNQSQVLFEVSLTIGAGEIVTLLGRNGMGKTTTVSSIVGILTPRSGTIWFDGKQVEGLPPYRIARRGVGLVPEGRQIFPNLTVTENLVATASNRAGRKHPWTLKDILKLFPALVSRADAMGSLLSGGEQQMLAIGRALMTNPKLLIFDEATEGLAPLIRAEIWRVIDQLKRLGQSILIIDKNIAALSRIADRHYVIEKGRIVWCGTSDELNRNSDLKHQYFGV